MTSEVPGSRLGARLLRTRAFVRAPIPLYRAGLGFLFGSRLLLLEHIGRKTGTRRFAVLEVVDRPTPDRIVIASGFGTESQWYRNIRAHPRVRIWIGARRGVAATATPMSVDESAAVLARYAAEHPRAWKRLRATIEQATGASVDGLPMVLLRLNPAD
ncbi:nitroreductase family deazaflavin-dependent oxidoreductase [Nocardia paucivorans]|uniref:nitroreductase family deazaflavin-dependent oxidoreductase n=1 Tax=Nocardia paucivorans TaxID=114259 RepID=UPI0003120AA7|nr:nitroreductase family deazaflavin-dependent oxidoreductase [Nocardia paucivorans]